MVARWLWPDFQNSMCLALRASGLWLRYATLQNLIPSFPWIAPPRPPPWRNPRKGRDQILQSGNLAGAVATTSPQLPRLGGGGRLAQIAAGQPIACNCGQVFPNLDILERHMAKAHPENTNLVSRMSKPLNSNFRSRELTSCLCSTAASAVCFEGRVAGLATIEKGNELSQPTFAFTGLFVT